MNYKLRFFVGLVLIAPAVILLLTNHGRSSSAPFIGLAVVGIALVATARKGMRKEKEKENQPR